MNWNCAELKLKVQTLARIHLGTKEWDAGKRTHIDMRAIKYNSETAIFTRSTAAFLSIHLGLARLQTVRLVECRIDANIKKSQSLRQGGSQTRRGVPRKPGTYATRNLGVKQGRSTHWVGRTIAGRHQARFCRRKTLEGSRDLAKAVHQLSTARADHGVGNTQSLGDTVTGCVCACS